MKRLGLLTGVVLLVITPAVRAEMIWLEAETPTATNFRLKKRAGDGNPFLFGGARLSAPPAKQRPLLFAEYAFKTNTEASRHFWVRKFWYHGPFRWRFNDQPWQICEREICLYDSVSAGPGDMSWIPLGRVVLPSGIHILRVEMLEFADGAEGSRGVLGVDTDGSARQLSPIAIDCFVLSEEKFVPRGAMLPGAPLPPVPEGWFAFAPKADPFAEAMLDLRGLNHSQAGDRGFLTARDGHFYFEKDATPTRFWGVVIGRNELFMDRDTMDDFARRMAKRGVNLVRFHDRFNHLYADDVADVTDRFVEHFNYFLAAMRREGIYVMLNIYYDRHTRTKTSFRLPDHTRARALPHFVFIHPAGEALWRSYARRLLGAANPHTGVLNVEDPTLAIVQLVNEDNYFFYTFRPHRTIPAGVMRHLETRYGAWLSKKYGGMNQARAAWGKCRPVPGDAFAKGRAGLYDARLLGVRAAGERRRHADTDHRFQDQAAFLTEDLRRWMGRQMAWLKSELGYRGLVNGGNWLTADNRVLTPLDKYANSVCDVMDRHGVGFPSVSVQKKFYAIAPGDAYQSTASVRDPAKTPMLEIQYGDLPHINSEPKKAMPNALRADWIPIQAVYAALQGTDGVTNFLMSPTWLNMHRVWSMATPVVLGQYPAAALMYRRGYIQEGPVVVDEHLSLAQLYALRPAAAVRAVGAAEWGAVAAHRGSLERIDPLSGYVGRVVRHIGVDSAPSKCRDLSAYIRRQEKTVVSATGELTWQWETGLIRINTPRAQGAVGFLKSAKSLRTANATIAMNNVFGAVMIVSLDGQPIAVADRILLQVASEDRNAGWKTRPTRRKPKRSDTEIDMEQIIDLGYPPIVVKTFDGTVLLHDLAPGAREVTAVDPNGYARDRLPGGADTTCRIELLPDCLYYVIDRRMKTSRALVSPPQRGRTSAVAAQRAEATASRGEGARRPTPRTMR